MKQILLTAGVLAVAALFAGVLVQSAPEPESGEVVLADRAAVIAQSCAACHGTEGRLVTAIPPIAGRPEAVLHAQLVAFKKDQMPGATVMPRLAKGFTDEELAALARYFSELPPE